MTNDEIQLYSDIVKTGLPIIGTLLGGVVGTISTLLFTIANHKHDNKKEAVKARRDLVLEIANSVSEFEQAIGTYATILNENLQGKIDAISLDTARRETIKLNLPIRKARMMLKILNLIEPDQKLESYIEASRRIIALDKNADIEEFLALKKTITSGPQNFYNALAPEVVF